MQANFKKWLINKDFRVLISNFISVSSLQLINYLLPLLTIPYLVQVIGSEKFGLVSLSQATMTFLVVLIDYGFNLSATQAIATNKNDPQKINKIFTSVFCAKVILLILSFIILFLLITVYDKFNKEFSLYLYSFTIVIGQAFFPLWYFLGIEKMKYIAIISSISKIIFTLLIFVLIKQPSDYSLVNLFMGIGSIVASLIAFILTYKHISFSNYNILEETKKRFKEGWEVFISSFAINSYIASNTIILGFFQPVEVVGFFAISEKIIMGVRQLLSVIFQVTYPYICRLAKQDHFKLVSFQKKILAGLFSIFLLIGCITFFYSEEIIFFIAKRYIEESVTILRILSFVPLIVALNIPAYQTLLSYELKKSYMSVLVGGSFLCLFLNTIFANYFAATGTAVSILFTEIFVTIGLYLILEHNHPNYSLLKFQRNESLS